MKSLLLVLGLALSLNCFARENRTSISNQLEVTATTTSTKFLNQNYNRNYLMIQNKGAQSIYIKFGSSQAAAEGILIPSGGNWEPILVAPDAIYIESSSATSIMTLIEGINP